MIHDLWCYSIYICIYHIQRVGCVGDDPLPECQVSSCRAFKKDVLLIYWACKIVWCCTRLGLTPPWTTYPSTSTIQGISTLGRKTTKAHSWSTSPAYIIRPYNTPQLLTLPPTSKLTMHRRHRSGWRLRLFRWAGWEYCTASLWINFEDFTLCDSKTKGWAAFIITITCLSNVYKTCLFCIEVGNHIFLHAHVTSSSKLLSKPSLALIMQ